MLYVSRTCASVNATLLFGTCFGLPSSGGAGAPRAPPSGATGNAHNGCAGFGAGFACCAAYTPTDNAQRTVTVATMIHRFMDTSGSGGSEKWLGVFVEQYPETVNTECLSLIHISEPT